MGSSQKIRSRHEKKFSYKINVVGEPIIICPSEQKWIDPLQQQKIL